jgi:hypothetical protein
MSHVLRVGVADQIAYFRAYNTDGSAKTDLTSATTGLTLSVFRIGASSVSIASLSNKAADNTAHADGAIRNVGGNLYTIDIPDAATATQVPSIVVRGTYTGGVIEGLEHPIVAYDPSVNYGSNAQSLDIQSRIPATLDLDGNMRSSVQSMASNVLNAAALAADAVTEIQSGLATSTGVTAAFTEIKGAGWSSSTDTLEKIAESSGGGGSSIMVTPVVAQTPVRVVGSNISTFIGDLSTIRIGVFSGSDPVDLTAFGDLEVCVQQKNGTDLDFVEMADLTIDGDDNNYVSWDPSGPSVVEVIRGKWSLRKSSNKQVIAYGAWIVEDAALEDVGS